MNGYENTPEAGPGVGKDTSAAASEPESVASALKTIEANRVSRIMDRLSAACTLGAGTQFNAVETASLRHHIRLLTYESVRPR